MSHPDWVGRTLGGRYRLESLVGQGGMAAVYRGFDPNLNRRVAVKLIHSHLTSDARFVRRFEAEAAAVAQLRHPNIIQVYDFSHDGPTYYMVLDYLPGETLYARLNSLTQAGGRLPVAEAAAIAATIADAVHYAHARGLVHRDIKPANIMLEPDGRAILMDFGIAKLLDATGMTETGNVLGTARYMAPELVLGQAPSPRADIYSLGILLFEMVAGEPPFDADSVMGLMLKHVNQQLPDLIGLNPATPPQLEAIVEQALHKDPTRRFAAASDMAAALRAVAGAARLAVQPPPPPAPTHANDPTVVDALAPHPPPAPPLAPIQPPPPAPGRANAPTVVDTPAAASLPAPIPISSAPVRAAVEPVPARASVPIPPPAAARPRRAAAAIPLIALTAAALGLLACLALAASGGLLGLASLRGRNASLTPTSPLASAEVYTHPSGAFTFSLPAGWLVSEQDTGVSAYPPDRSAELRLDFTHVGTRLTQAGLEAFVTAVETNLFAGFENYQSDGLTAQPDGRVTVLKTLAVPNGPPQTVFSQTWQDGLVVYEQHLWVPTRDYDRLAGGLLEIAATIETDAASAAQAPLYVAVYPFTTPNGEVEFTVPYAWAHRTYDNDDGHVEEFASPDDTTFVGSVTYTAQQPFSAAEADVFAAYLLQAYYASDMHINTAEDLDDGRKRLDWSSPSRRVEGVSYLQTRGNQFFMLNWTVAADLADLYLPVWDVVLNSYRLR